jgi:carbon monoxide dehydrogenase subunit G
MATVHREIEIQAPPEAVWDAVRDFAAVHERVAPGFLVALEMDGDATRIVTFANGMVAHETLVGIDDAARRLAYTIRSEQLQHHSASVQILADGDNTRFVWITDVLPDAAAETIGAMMEQGARAAKRTLERQPASAT